LRQNVIDIRLLIIYIERVRKNQYGFTPIIITTMVFIALCIVGFCVWNSKHKTNLAQVDTGDTFSSTFIGTIAVHSCDSSDCPPYTFVTNKGEECNFESIPDIKSGDDGKKVKTTGKLNQLEAGPNIVQVKSLQFE
jgi:hypothetical protein